MSWKNYQRMRRGRRKIGMCRGWGSSSSGRGRWPASFYMFLYFTQISYCVLFSITCLTYPASSSWSSLLQVQVLSVWHLGHNWAVYSEILLEKLVAQAAQSPQHRAWNFHSTTQWIGIMQNSWPVWVLPSHIVTLLCVVGPSLYVVAFVQKFRCL